jgi:diguanylate cyclase (GGDEF)-like protein/PAS domain S-box-containing protein
VISAALAAYAWRRRAIPGTTAFFALLLSVAEWSFSYALELGSSSLASKLFWAKVEYLGIVIVPAAWLVFSLQYSGHIQKLSRRALAALALMPTITLLLVWTNHLHGLIWSSLQLDPGGSILALSLRYGAGFWIHTLYSYLLILAGTLVLLRFYLLSRVLYRQQIKIVLAAAFVPWLSNALYIFRLNPIPSLDLTPFAFTVTGILFAWGSLRLQFLDIFPLARGAILDGMRDAVIVLDAWNRIAFMNQAAEAMTQRKSSQIIGVPASQVFSDHPESVSRFDTAIVAQEVLVVGDPAAPLYINLQISPLYDRLGRFSGRLAVLQDITEQERAKLALQKSHAELDRRVQERTVELKTANRSLEKEIIERKSVETALRDRIELERLVSSISTNFINLMVDEIDQAINRALHTIGKFAGVDRSYIFRISTDGATITNTHEWSAPGIAPQKEHLVEIPCASLPWWMSRLYRQEIIHIPLYATLPQEARQEKEILRSKDIHSLVVVPLVYGKTLIGFLGFDSSHKEKVWADDDIALLRLVGEIFTNAFARKDVEEALLASDAELRGVFAAMNDQVLLCDRSGRILKIAPTHPASYHLPAKELTGKSLNEVLPAEAAASIIEQIRNALAAQKTVQVDYSLTMDGKQLWYSGAISPVQKDRVVLVSRDITERKASEERLIYQTLHDALTGLPNSRWFIERLGRAFARIKRHPDENAAVLFLDLDGFKAINDSWGHPIGDRFLATIGQRLRTSMRITDTVARLGGDEFAVLLEDIRDIDEAVQVAGRIQLEVSAPVDLDGRPVSSSASIGIALFSAGYLSPEEILKDADTAMYRAKANGRGRHEIFSAEAYAPDLHGHPLPAELHRAIDRGEFQLFYQPVVDLKSGETTSVEALLRWRHPERGLLLPDEFLSLAEATRLSSPIGEWVLRTACAQLKDLHAAGYHHLRIAVNTSTQQFRKHGLQELVPKVLAEVDLDPQFLEIEISEQTARKDAGLMIPTLEELSQLGVNISIDDFGKASSSLSDLKGFPTSALKMDHSVIQDSFDNPESALKSSAIIALAHSQNLSVIAKGVETHEQLAFAAVQGCDLIQGFCISRAMPAIGLAEFLRERTSIPIRY